VDDDWFIIVAVFFVVVEIGGRTALRSIVK
jgi:hypothetical protein